MTTNLAPNDIGAVVVLYHPDAGFVGNIRSYAGQVGHVVVVDNTPDPPAGVAQSVAEVGAQYVALGENRGIAVALNEGTRRLREAGYAWALTMDDDSVAPDGFVAALADCVGETGDDVAIVAPLWEQVGGLVETHGEGCRELDWAMTSGNLLRLSALDAVGGFDDALFIDQVDNDLCFRLRLADWRILQARGAVLRHRQGTLRQARLGFWVTDYPAIRRYYMARNTTLVRARYGDNFPAWVAAERAQWRLDLAKILLGERGKADKIRKIIEGLRDARAGLTGSYEELHG